MATHSSTLAWRRRSLVGCSPWGREESELTEQLHFHFHALEKEMATHSSVLAWRIPGMAEPGGLLSMGSHRVGHDWSDLAAAAAASMLRDFTGSPVLNNSLCNAGDVGSVPGQETKIPHAMEQISLCAITRELTCHNQRVCGLQWKILHNAT